MYSSEVGYWVWFHTSYTIALTTSDLTRPVIDSSAMLSSVERENLGTVNVAAQFLVPQEWRGVEVTACPDTYLAEVHVHS